MHGRREGAVSVAVAVVLPLLLGTAGLVVEYGHGVLQKVENQRIADLSAYAGALAYNATSSEDTMRAAAKAAAVVNGVAATNVVATIVASPTGTPSINAVKVAVTTNVSLIFARLLGSGVTLAVPAEAYAELRPTVGSCILALSATAGGVALTGGTQLNAPTCAVASNAAVSVPCGTFIRTIGVVYNSAAVPSQPCSGIQGPGGTVASIVKRATPDPLAGNADIAAARARLTSVAALVAPTVASAPAAPVVTSPGGTFTSINFDIYTNGGTTTKTSAATIGCTATNSGTNWTFTCPAGNRLIGTLAIAGGQTVTFVGTTGTKYYFSQAMNTGPFINFGTGSFTFLQGLTIGYGGVTIGAGSLAVLGNLSTGASGGTATFGSGNISVTGNIGMGGTTSFTGSGTLAVGGNLTTGGTPAIAQSAITVTGAMTVTNSIAFNALTSLKVGGLTTLGTSGTISFAGGTYTLTGGLHTSGATTITVGAGTYAIGRSAATCNSGQFSLCSNAASLTFAGPSVFELPSGVAVGGGSTLVLGSSGTANSFRIGASATGNAVQIGGGALVKFGDATAVGSVFEIGGTFNIASGGGSCTVLSAATHHDISGSLVTAGATVLGDGAYTVTGSVGIGSNGGGNVMCYGQTVGLQANVVSIVVGAAGTGLTGTCSGQAFCVAAGYSSVKLSAPLAGTYKRMAVIGPVSDTRGAYFTEGSSSTTLSGLVYFPVGSVRLDGAASVGNGTGECLQLIGKDIALTGGSLLASTCVSGAVAGGKVVLVK